VTFREVAATSALHDLQVVAYVDRLGYSRCRTCAEDLDEPGEPATPSAFSIEDRCETCDVVLRSVGCAHWRSPTVDVSPHPTLQETDLVTRRCEKCGAERVLHSGRGRYRDPDDPDRGADRHTAGRPFASPRSW
jgi:hypothetical protein